MNRYDYDWRERMWERRRARWTRYHRRWRNRPRFLFFRFAGVFGFIVLFFVGSITGVVYIVNHLLQGSASTDNIVWVAALGLALAFALTAGSIALSAFRRIALPLADVMEAADAVAEGDLSVRVDGPRGENGEFGRLVSSFNRMVEELERAEQQRRNLTADVAHELRNPLHVLRGNLEGLLDGVYAPTEEHLNAMMEETELLSRLVEDLQTLSLAEAGELALKLEALDVNELLRDIETSFSGQAAAASVELVLDLDSAPLTIQGDADRLEQVLTNLVANALRHTPTGGSISLISKELEAQIEISVSDTGEGIPPEDLPYIFDRFWRGDRSRSRQDGSGAGLGLAIARQLVRAHGGDLTAESTPGEGSRFIVHLPKDGEDE